MDIIKPELVWIEGRCYRFPDHTVWSSKQTCTPYEEDYDQMEDDMNNEVNSRDCDIAVEILKDGRYQHTVNIPQVFYRFLIGHAGSIKKNLECETKTMIKIPNIGSKHTDIVITGKNRSSVISCRQRIDLIVESSKKKIPFTHFVSIPLNEETIINNFIKFKNEILNDSEIMSKGLMEDFFVSPNKFHLTIGMLLLINNEDKKKAVETLNACVNEIIKPILQQSGPLKLKIQGVEIMNDDEKRVTVLYGKVLKNDILQEIANKTFNFFIQKDLMSVQYTEAVKLHMTLIKTSRVTDKSSKKNSSLAQFDATKILKNYKDYYFGESQLEKINISARNTETDVGHYETLTEINLLK
ncbi:activating signal cointegrator 1 complex subunit 1 [Microplitis mediator]|uniref:activating signal cointegrator 1 complex subunit 1 n=1 Tax=Microplitis mediator TaxID=375433 RepID=UPI0025549DE9|nr:activating signal cointegrator 1 complex subunit 1 [Microplitis mediator]